MQNFLGKGHILITDNFYSSPMLAKCFIENKTHLCRTVQTNRYNYLKDIVNQALQKSETCSCAKRGGPMIACKCRANKDKASGQQKVVFVISTCHRPP